MTTLYSTDLPRSALGGWPTGRWLSLTSSTVLEIRIGGTMVGVGVGVVVVVGVVVGKRLTWVCTVLLVCGPLTAVSTRAKFETVPTRVGAVTMVAVKVSPDVRVSLKHRTPR